MQLLYKVYSYIRNRSIVCRCCASRVERRKQEEEIMKKSKDQPAYSLPDDEACNSNYKEEWWNGQTIKNF